jgi:hypothetical protein
MKIVTRKYESTPIVTWGEYFYSFNPFRTIYWTVTSIEAGFIEIANQIVMMEFSLILEGEKLKMSHKIPADIQVENIQLILSSIGCKNISRTTDAESNTETAYLPYLDCISITNSSGNIIYVKNTDSLRHALNDYLDFRSLNKLPIKQPSIS